MLPILCGNFLSLVICLFGLGVALGCDHPTAHMIISESIPSLRRGNLVLAAFGLQALAALADTGVGFAVLSLMLPATFVNGFFGMNTGGMFLANAHGHAGTITAGIICLPSFVAMFGFLRARTLL